MEDMLIAMAVTTLLQAIKNPKKKEQLKKALLKVRNTINAVYSDDPDFQ